MKQLSDNDIEQMKDKDFHPDDYAIRRCVRAELKLSQRIPDAPAPVPERFILDLHHKTEDQAWDEIMRLATSGVRRATIITGASGILHQKFSQWATESILAPYIISSTPINNGSFDVRFRRIRDAHKT